MKHLKIVQLTAENIKRIQAVEITPKGDVVTIAGANGQGKSSILDSIWWALAGASHIQAQPIRRGAEKAKIRLDLGELIVERRFTQAGTTLYVENADGARYQSPQKMLDALIGELSFDPLAFSRLHGREQFNTLRKIVDVGIDLDEVNKLNTADYGKRTDLNREIKLLKTQIDSLALTLPDDLPEDFINEAEILNEMETVGQFNADIETRRANRERMMNDAVLLRDRAKQLLENAEALELQAKDMREAARKEVLDAENIEEKINNAPALPELKESSEIRARLDKAKVINAALEKKHDRDLKIKQIDEVQKDVDAITAAMEKRTSDMQKAISKAKMPVEGLGFGDDVVTFNGIAFDQCSSAEQLKVSMAIAMAMNPKLRVIRITDGSLLDETSLAAIDAMAKEHDYQVWIERVDTSGKIGIVIEDGLVKSTN